MSAVLEEDVLAFLVLNMALGELSYESFGGPEWSALRAAIDDWKAKDWPHDTESVARVRLASYDHTHVAAIADSERRWEVERCEREVLDAVENWDGSLNPFFAAGQLRAANAKLRRARMVLTHAR